MSMPRFVLACAAFAFVPLPAEAQQLLRAHADGYGSGAASLADLDGDAVPDYAVQRFDPDAERDAVELRSGASGALIRSIPSGEPSKFDSWLFGWALADAGDVDGDGVHDVLIGAPQSPDPTGAIIGAGGAFVYSGRDGSLLWSAYGAKKDQRFGGAVAGLDDVDGDGHADFLVASPTNAGRMTPFITAFSGASGATLYVVQDALAPTRISDRDRDGIRDFVEVLTDVHVRSGATGALLATLSSAVGFSGGLAELDDLDGDGERELAVGEFGAVNRLDGQVRVVSIPTGATVRTHLAVEANELLGQHIDAGLDADGDGVRDYLASAASPFGPPGSASLFSGRTGERLYRFIDFDADFSMGNTVTGLGDLDGDGFDECLIGSPEDTPPGTGQLGADLLFRGGRLWFDAYPKSVAAGEVETAAIHGAPCGKPIAIFIVGVDGAPRFQLLGMAVSGCNESFFASAVVPAGLTGSRWVFRAYALDEDCKLMTSADEVIEFR
jgi:hypothetical protein